jgi:mRNA interferase MazF
MQSTTTYSRGDIVLVPYPFSDRLVVKNRPALIISSAAYHSSRYEVVIAAITSRIRSPLLIGDYLIQDWRGSGLSRPSVVTGILRTAKAYLIRRHLGKLPARELVAVTGTLREALEL